MNLHLKAICSSNQTCLSQGAYERPHPRALNPDVRRAIIDCFAFRITIYRNALCRSQNGRARPPARPVHMPLNASARSVRSARRGQERAGTRVLDLDDVALRCY